MASPNFLTESCVFPVFLSPQSLDDKTYLALDLINALSASSYMKCQYDTLVQSLQKVEGRKGIVWKMTKRER